MTAPDDMHDVPTRIKDLYRVVKACERIGSTDSKDASALCMIAVMKCAYWVRKSSSDFLPEVAESDGSDLDIGPIPKLSTLGGGLQKYRDAEESANASMMAEALEEMGVLQLCPSFARHVEQMGRIVITRMQGSARLVLFLDIANFCIEIEDFVSAAKYADLTREAKPHSYELYSLLAIDGILAFEAGDIVTAVAHLNMSLNAAREDIISCSIRPPNFGLPERLLRHGERREVISHLAECRSIWRVLDSQIERWIKDIDAGIVPIFSGHKMLEGMQGPRYLLEMQWLRVQRLRSAMGGEPSVLASKELTKTAGRYSSDRISKTIKYLDKEWDIPEGS